MNSSIPVAKERIGYLDMLKGLAMCIIVSGHIHNEYGWFSLPLQAFAIPMYFMLSGMTFRREKFATVWDLIKRRAKTLLLPYVMFALLTWAFWAVFSIATHRHTDIWSPLLQVVLSQGSGEFLTFNPPLWFITCLFVIEVMYFFIDRLPEWANILCCVACAFIGHWMVKGPYLDFFRLLPWNIEGAMTAILFYCTGNVLTKHLSLKEIENRVLSFNKFGSIAYIIVVTTILVFVSYWNGHVSIGSNLLGKSTLVYYLTAYMGISTIFLFSILVCSINTGKRYIDGFVDFGKWFGRKSFWVMATHVPVKNVLLFGIAGYIGKSIRFVRNDYFWCAVIFTITIGVCCLFCLVIERWKKKDEERVQRWREQRKTVKSVGE